MMFRLLVLGLGCAIVAAISLDVSKRMYALMEEPDPIELAPRDEGCYTDGGQPR